MRGALHRAGAGRPRRLGAVSVALLMLAVCAVPAAASSTLLEDAPPTTANGNPSLRVERLSGADRYATAVAISRRFFSPGVSSVFVASGLDFPDALAAGPAAASRGVPVLFTHRDWLPSSTLAEIQRLKPGRIYVIGGSPSVSDSVAAQLEPLAPSGVTRIAGGDRYATAAAVSRTFFASASTVYVVYGGGFADGLTGGAAAAVKGSPVLLVGTTRLPSSTAAELERLAPTRIVIVGGTSVVSSSLQAALGAFAPTVQRLAGADRYATGVAVSKATFPNAAGAAFVASGQTFPDALAGIAAAGRRAAPLLLVPRTWIPTPVADELDRLDPDALFVVGGEPSVSQAVVKLIQKRLGICWSAFKPPAGSQQVFTRVPNAPSQVALTFDMGGRLDPAVSILQYLIDNQVCATIFPTGVSSQTTLGRQVLALIRSHPELFEVGNHTVHHCNLRDGGGPSGCPSTPPSSTFIRSELTGAESIIAPMAGQSTLPYWRPPYGAYNSYVLSAAAGAGYTKTFMWDVDTIDWDPDTTTQQIVSRVLDKATSGSVVLMHLGGYHTRDALPTVVSELRSRGFTVTSLSDMLDG